MPARTEDEPSIELWEGDAPGSEGQDGVEAVQIRYPGFRAGWDGDAAGERIIWNVHRPSITLFLPKTYSEVEPSPAVLLIPGGGHQALCFDLEGTFVGRWLAERGVAAFVLKYRLSEPFGDAQETPYDLSHSVIDTQRAMRMIRLHAAEWHIDPVRVGAMGFSAGGCVPPAAPPPRVHDAPLLCVQGANPGLRLTRPRGARRDVGRPRRPGGIGPCGAVQRAAKFPGASLSTYA
jgi:hypothetical protein